MKRIKIGDTVKCRGGWGSLPEEEVKIEAIEICASGRKFGRYVKSIAETTKDRCVFSLDNHHWAYGNQITL